MALAVAVSAWGQFTLPSGTTSTGTTSTGSTTSQSALGGQSTQGIDTTQLLQAAGASSSTSQKTSLSVTVPESQVRAMLAMSTPEYPVTPGDVYALSYLRATQQDTISLLVEGDGSINAGFLGRIQTSGMTFRALKEMLEKKVIASYPSSNPSLVIVSTGLFSVNIRGEVLSSQIFTAWGLTRLSEAVKGLATPYASLRDVIVRGRDGASKAYDLFKADRFGDPSQDPLLRPGDVIEVKKADRIILLEGQVRRPGIYQLLPGEGVGELVRVYGDGTLVSAKTDTIVLTHKASAEKPASESIVFDLIGSSLPALVDGDTVRVVSREEYLPVVYVEGAVQAGTVLISESAVSQAGTGGTSVAQGTASQSGAGQGTAGTTGTTTQAAVAQAGSTSQKDAYGLVRVVYRQGQRLSQVIKPIQLQLSSKADLAHAYLIRGSQRIGIDLEQVLYNYRADIDVVLEAGDRVVIPYGYASVYVKGEVKASSVTEVFAGMRLADAVKGNLTALSSQRDITVTSSDGKVVSYDLFKADRFGDLSQNPLLRPGDVVEVSKAVRIVSIEGEVRRPGRYQLLPGEGVKELVSYYGDGALESGKTDLVVLTRKATSQKPESESVVFDLGGKGLPELMDGDRVRIPSREEYLPIVYIEGAVAGDQLALSGANTAQTLSSNNQTLSNKNPTLSTTDQTVSGTDQTTTSKDQSLSSANQTLSSSNQNAVQATYAIIRAPFRKGLSISSLLRPMKDKILSSADLAHAFIIRKGNQDQNYIDLERLLYANDLRYDFELQPEDRIVIPFGSMSVFVTGEVTKSSWVTITGLTRLRDVIQPFLTRYSSIRDVTVKNQDGIEKTYDLFKADRYGDLSQDPLLRPGDEIRILPFKNLITIQGEVKRPGTYQLLPGEGLKELVERYADGFTEKANLSRLTIVHYLSDASPVGEKAQFDYTKNPNMPLRLYDEITVPSMQELLPVVWFEGAVGVGSTGSTPETSQRTPYTFFPGETVSQAALANRKLFSAVSDLSNAYLLRSDGSRTKVNLARFIYDYDLAGDVALQPGDTIIVPFRQFFVSVSGAVRYPGRYPYIPDREWSYYIGLAGGFDTEKNSGQKITIYDAKSQKVDQANRMIQPEDNIVAASNSFTYQLMRISTILSTVLSLVAIIVNLTGLKL